jgi:hypothetical protein
MELQKPFGLLSLNARNHVASRLLQFTSAIFLASARLVVPLECMAVSETRQEVSARSSLGGVALPKTRWQKETRKDAKVSAVAAPRGARLHSSVILFSRTW